VGKSHVYHGVLDIPEGQVNGYQIVHDRRPAGTTFNLANVRTMMMGGDQQGSVTFSEPTRWHKLLEDGGVWMSDWPIEQAQHDRTLTPIRRGRVLVGGLGVGYATTVLALRKQVREVVVVEISPEVCALVEPFLLRTSPARAKIKVIQQDLFRYLAGARERGEHFDWAFYDIWASDGEGTFFEIVCPLLEQSHKIVRHSPICWNENVMRGQLALSLHSRYQMMMASSPEFRKTVPSLEEMAVRTGSIWHDWAVPFFSWIQARKPSQEQVKEAIRCYAGTYGYPGFPIVWDFWMRRQQ